MGEIALRTGKLHTKSADLPATLAKTTPIVVAETPPPLAAYAFLGLAGIVYLAGVAASLRRPGSKSLPLAGLAVSIGALFFGIALYVL